jgi:hypothetical protein
MISIGLVGRWTIEVVHWPIRTGFIRVPRNFRRGYALAGHLTGVASWETAPSMSTARPNRSRTGRRFVAPWRSNMVPAVTTKTNRCRRSSCIWWGAATPMPARNQECLPARRPRKLERKLERLAYWMNSPHFCTVASPAPQGMTGTDEVEFFGEPSISLSE